MTNLAELRTQLAEAKNALRDDKATLETTQAVVEYGATIVGKNAEDRKREMAYILTQSGAYQTALTNVLNSQSDVESFQALVASAEDELTAARIAAVNHLADALTALASRKSVDSVIVDTVLPDDWVGR
jgi:hypothetical protein